MKLQALFFIKHKSKKIKLSSAAILFGVKRTASKDRRSNRMQDREKQYQGR